MFISDSGNALCPIFVDGNFLAIGSHDNCIYIYGVSDNGRKYTRVGKCSVSAPTPPRCVCSYLRQQAVGQDLWGEETQPMRFSPRVTPASSLTWTGL